MLLKNVMFCWFCDGHGSGMQHQVNCSVSTQNRVEPVHLKKAIVSIFIFVLISVSVSVLVSWLVSVLALVHVSVFVSVSVSVAVAVERVVLVTVLVKVSISSRGFLPRADKIV